MDKRQSETKQLATQGIILVVASFAVRFIGFFYRIPLTNLWGDEGNDAYSMAYQIYNLCIIISSFGVPATISRMIGKRIALKQYANAKRVVQVAFGLIGGISIVCGLFLWIGCYWIADVIFGVPAAAIAIRVQAPTLVIVAFMSVLRGLFQGANNMKPTAVSQVIEQIINAITSLVFAYALFGYGLEWGVAGGISGAGFGGIAALVFLMFCYVLFRRSSWMGSKYTASRYITEGTKEIVAEMLMLIVPIVLATSVMNIKSILDSSIFIPLMNLKGYSDSTASTMRGIYQGKFVLLTTLPIAIGNALGTASVPSIARSITLKERKEVRKKITMQIKLILLIALPASVGMAIIGKPLLRLLYPRAYQGGELFWVGSAQIVFYSLVHVATGILQGIGRVQVPVKNAIAGAVVSLVANVLCILVLNLGIYSLVINDLVFSGVLAYLDVQAVCQYGKVRLRWRRIIVKPLLSSLIMGIVCFVSYILAFTITGSNLLAIVAAVGLAVITYFVVLVNIGGLTEADMANLPMGQKLRFFRFR